MEVGPIGRFSMSFDKVTEAPLERGEGGLEPQGEGWFVVNVADAAGIHFSRFGHACTFEGVQRFPEFGINVHVFEPGQPSGLYHREQAQEAFLVLDGQCLAIVEEQERLLRTGDFLHCPPGTAHILVGAGDAPCTVLMVGSRSPDATTVYPESEIAARHLAAVAHETDDAKVAYAGTSPPTPRAFGGVPW
jgi:uncharacterized cupin superfamily protein